MGKPGLPETALLFTGALFQDPEYFIQAKESLCRSFGEIIFESPPLKWDYSDYYAEELGLPITRKFLFFRELIDASRLPDIKLRTNEIEGQYAQEGKRTINIDPGCMTLAKVVLASTKNYSHRIYMGRGIYAEVTLVYRDGGYQPHLFTYRDFASDAVRGIFQEARGLLKQE